MVPGKSTAILMGAVLLLGAAAVHARPLRQDTGLSTGRTPRMVRLSQVTMPAIPAPEADPAPAPDNATPASPGNAGPATGAEGSSRNALGSGASTGTPDEKGAVADLPPRKLHPKNNLFSFGLQLGQPTGLTVQARLLERNTFVGSVAWDFFYRSLTFAADYRFSVYTLELVKYDTEVSFFIGAGVRVGAFEPVKPYLRELPFSAGLRLPAGASLRLRPLPMEFTLAVSPVGFDFKEIALTFPRWRPEAVLEVKCEFPFAPF